MTALGSTILPIRDCQRHFPELEVLVLEVNERRGTSRIELKDPGTPCDYEILKDLWHHWFTTLHIKNANENFFIQRNDATILTINEVDKLFGSK